MIEWKYIIIDDEETDYTIDILGRVYSCRSEKYLKPFPNPQGYMLVDIHHNKRSYTRQVHRLVALAFIPNPLNLETVNHKDGNKSHNFVENLEWMTRIDNVHHAWETGLAKPRYGIDNPANVYTEDQIHQVCSLLELRTVKGAEIARICNVNVSLITDIKFRGKWKHISKLYDIPKHVLDIKKYVQSYSIASNRVYPTKKLCIAWVCQNLRKCNINYVDILNIVDQYTIIAASTTNRGTS